MKEVYKLTDQNLQTHNGFQWKLGEWRQTSGNGHYRSNGWNQWAWCWLLGIDRSAESAKLASNRAINRHTGLTADWSARDASKAVTDVYYAAWACLWAAENARSHGISLDLSDTIRIAMSIDTITLVEKS